ncbi:MAG: hypothetical protein IT329_22710 [Caldilineaceae bacterium]|nr:hypothetical protein [Caldilineaceae bacterium]
MNSLRPITITVEQIEQLAANLYAHDPAYNADAGYTRRDYCVAVHAWIEHQISGWIDYPDHFLLPDLPLARRCDLCHRAALVNDIFCRAHRAAEDALTE